jgi:non-ribosomal peptide synthetase component F
LTKETETTFYMALMAAYTILLAKLSRSADIVVGSPITGRRNVELQHVIGVFVNMLAVRNKPEGDKRFIDFLLEVKEKVLASMENQDYPFDELVGRLGLQGDISRNPLFNVVLAMQNMRMGDIRCKNFNVSAYPLTYSISRFDLTLFAREADSEIKMGLEYSTELFRRSTAEKIAGQYIEILEQVLENHQVRIKDINLSHNLLTVSSEKRKSSRDTFNF